MITGKINTEQLKSALLRRKTIRNRFKLPLTSDQTLDALRASVQAEVEYRQMPYALNDFQTEQTSQAAKWLHGEGKSGLLLVGLPGNGKTTLMNAIVSLVNYTEVKNAYGEFFSIQKITAIDLARLCRDDYKRYKQLAFAQGLAIDDMGLEPVEVNDYGNVLNPIVDVITRRYDEQLLTMITSNLTPADIRNRYSIRISERLREMMDVIVFENTTYRK